MRLRAFIVLVLMLSVALSAGCASQQNRQLQAKLMQMARTPQTVEEYVVAPPDQISVEVWGAPEYSRNMVVRPDGKVTIPSLGDLYVQGKTLPEITQEVTELLSKELAQPNVTVSLVTARSKAVFILGEVRRPARIDYYGDMKLIDAIGYTGGLTMNASAGKIKVTRASLDKPEILKINLRKLVYDGAAEQNIVLEEGDIIYVPPTAFAKVGYAMSQLLFPFRSALGAVVTYSQVNDAFTNNN